MKKVVLVMTVLALMIVSVTAQATQFMNITFDGDTVRSVPATGASGSPITRIGAIGGYTATDYFSPPTPANGTIVVDNVSGMNKAAVLTTNPTNGAMGALWMDTGLSLVSSKLSVTFDISVLAAPTTATTQGGYSLDGGVADKGILFGLRAYASTSTVAQWAFSFAVTPTSDTGGVFALRDSTNTQLTSFGTYVEGQKYSIAICADYALGTADAYVNGVLGYSGYPLRTGALANAPLTSELFIYLNGESDYANQIAIDNIRGYDTPVPIPGAVWLLGSGLVGLAGLRRRMKK